MDAAAEVSNYPGAPLPTKNHVRMLKILEASHEHDPVICTMETADLSTAPEFSALSYTWNPPLHPFAKEIDVSASRNSTYEVVLNGHNFPVTENLFDALRQLRSLGLTGPLWIDAVCISQLNLTERSQQVANMGRIYGAAHNVIVWLGKDSDCLEDMNWAIDTLLPQIKERPMEHFASGIMATDSVAALRPRATRAMKFIADRRWFHRAWIVQEITLSKAVRLFCGCSEISWEDFVTFHKVLGLSEWGALLPSDLDGDERREAYWTARNSIERFQDIRDFLKVHGLQPNSLEPRGHATSVRINPGAVYGDDTEIERAAAWLAYLILAIREQDCAVQHDKVYSVLGIADCFSLCVKDLIQPNYSLSFATVYRTVAASLIMENRYLSVLGHVGDLEKQSSSDLPSWAADYSVAPGFSPLTVFGHSRSRAFDASAAHSSKRCPRAIEGLELSLQGAFFSEVSHALKPHMSDLLGSKCDIEEFDAFGGSLPLKYTNGQEMIDAIWRTFVFDTARSESFGSVSPAPESYRKSFMAWWISQCTVWLARQAEEEGVWAPRSAIRFLCQLFNPEAQTVLNTNDFKLALTHLLVTETTLRDDPDAFDKYRQEMMPFMDACKRKSDGRRLFKTKDDFVGLGTLSTQPGDQVWLIKDALVPLILRPVRNTDTYQLVGEAYLHGFMYGEMLEPQWRVEERIQQVKIV